MATNTTNFSLVKPAYTDTADIAEINGNMDKVDVSLNGLADAIAIVANNNTHAAITEGQYVYVHGHSSLTEGLYTAKSNIAANATLSTSNLQADGSGGLNALNSKLTTISSGSLHDIKSCGAYYITNAVTDKPTSTGGSYVVGSNGNAVGGIFTQNTTGNTYAVRYDGSTWSYEQLALNSKIEQVSTAVPGLRCTKTGTLASVLLNALGSVVTMSSDGKTLNQIIPSDFRPERQMKFLGKVYNGSSYVDCNIIIDSDGKIQIVTLFGGTISGVSPGAIAPTILTYQFG